MKQKNIIRAISLMCTLVLAFTFCVNTTEVAFASQILEKEVAKEKELQIEEAYTREEYVSKEERIQSLIETPISKDISESVLVELEIFENELDLMDTSVEEELNDLIESYENMLKSEVDANEQIKIQRLIDTTQELLENTEVYNNILRTQQSSNAQLDNVQQTSLIHSATTAAVVAYFNLSGYDLSAELLIHAKDNTSLNSIYEPVNKNLIIQTQVFYQIVNGVDLKGRARFVGNSPIEKDVEYAIKDCDFRMSQSKSVIEITDRYDYAAEEFNLLELAADVAINSMYNAQEAGYLTPFYTKITHVLRTGQDPTAQGFIVRENDKYVEKITTLGPGEVMEYNFRFESSGYRVIQTLGVKDTRLYVYEGTTLIYDDDDDGYSTNASISGYFEANTQYKIRLKFYSDTKAGDIKLGIFNASTSSVQNLNGESDYHSSSTSLNSVRPYNFTPQTQGDYEIKATSLSNIDTYLYLLDPRSTVGIYEKYLPIMDVDNPSLRANQETIFINEFNDDANGRDAMISKKLAKNIPYIIILSTYNITTSSGNYKLEIDLI